MKFTRHDLESNKVSEQDYYSQFVDDCVLNCVASGSIYRNIIHSKDHDEFSDLYLRQWDTATASIMLCVKSKFKRADDFVTQNKLLMIAKIAARDLLIAQGLYKNPKQKINA